MSGLAKAAGIPSANMTLQLLAPATSPTQYIEVANLGDFTGPGYTRTVVDTSKHGDEWERAVTTLKSGGEIAGPIWFDPANTSHTAATDGLLSLFESGDLRAWRIVLFDSTGAEKHVNFNAYVQAFGPLKMPVKGVLATDFKLKVDGAVTRDF